MPFSVEEIKKKPFYFLLLLFGSGEWIWDVGLEILGASLEQANWKQ